MDNGQVLWLVPRFGATILTMSWIMAEVATTAGADGSDWGSLRGRFVYDGAAPERENLNMTTDIEFCSKHHPMDDSLIVKTENGGLANVVVSLYLKRGAALPAVHASYGKTATDNVTLTNAHCRFEPRVVLLRTTQTLEIHNVDEVGHNTKIDTTVNPGINRSTPAGQSLEHRFTRPERKASPVGCSIHPWMSAWIVISDHPYAAVADENGKFEIKHVPVGKWTFQAWHERAQKSGRISEVVRDGKRQSWKRGRVTVTIAPGENNLGELKLSPSLF